MNTTDETDWNADLTEWQPKDLPDTTPVILRVHQDGFVMWHRNGCTFGGHTGGLSVGEATGLPYSAFLEAFSRAQRHHDRLTLFCGGCLVYRPKSPG